MNITSGFTKENKIKKGQEFYVMLDEELMAFFIYELSCVF